MRSTARDAARAAAHATVELADIQGLVRSNFRTLPSACFSVFTLGDPAGARRFLRHLAAEVTSAAARDARTATQVALSASGLRSLALPERILGQFSHEFQEGITTPNRSRFLGDVPSAWTWGAPGSARPEVLVCTYARTEAELDEALTEVQAAATECGVTSARELFSRQLSEFEPFGFRDGISDPYVPELSSTAQAADPPQVAPVALGEFVLGYRNSYGAFGQRPVLTADQDPGGLLPVLPPGVDPRCPGGGADLGRNGSFLVLRTLEQDVEGFVEWINSQAKFYGIDPHLLGAKLVGRWPSGAPVTLSPDRDRPELAYANDFGYHHDDPLGRGCPIGAHVRRANPRDSLDPRPGSAQSLAITDRHRILRRGRTFASPDGSQGLQFVALNANLARQFEFIQHSWLDNPKFGGLYDDVDALVGSRTPRSVFTMPDLPLRRRFTGLPEFVTPRGGEYFFLPGLRALRFLAREPR